MSYILDALRKSEIERQRGSVPSLQTLQEAGPDVRKKRPRLSLLLLALLLLNAVLLFIWLSPWQGGRGDSTARKSVQLQGTPLRPGAPVGTDSRNVAPPATEESPGVHQKMAGNSRTGHDNREAAGIKADKLSPATPLVQQHASGTGADMAEAPPRQQHADNRQAAVHADIPVQNGRAQQPVPNISALDFSVSSQLPDIAFAGHVYADQPAARMVMINNHMYHEGARITGNLILEEITPTGAVFRFHGRKFRMNVMQTWSKH